MDEDRNTGVTEARFALSIVICLLVAIGYFVLARLGSSNEATIEARPTEVLRQPPVDVEEDDEPQVLTIDEGDDASLRPRKVAERSVLNPQPAANGQVIPAGSFDSQRR